ncbi:alpha-amylase family glycosyl hydrolase [Halobaculum sp. D14]|uniref:alpha-amylase family glycosyl hydrolase n=1 Tax=Halobaculum sp. D14 TaxID=3421642 RepID=UPI003EBD7BFC
MRHPGPPRFTSVGEPVELAPRAPDPDADYTWTVADAPDGAAASVPDDPVVEFAPAEPGTYRLRLDGPTRTFSQTVRVFPDERRPARFELHVDDLPVPASELESLCLVSHFNERLVGADRPVREGDTWAFETELPPGHYPYGFCIDDDLHDQVRDDLTVPGPGRPRVRLDATVDGDHVVVTAEPSAAVDSDRGDDDVDVEFFVDDRDSLPADAATVDGRTLRVPVEEAPDRLRVHGVAVGERHSVADTVDVRLGDEATGSESSVVRPNDPPEWAASPTVYEIFVRSFAGETPDTTFAELERRVPYLESLGVDCVWLTPVLESPTTHGYHVTNYFETASDLGSRAGFESFVDACHDAGIRVVFDLVINHTSRDHPFFQFFAAGVDDYDDHYLPRDNDVGAQYYFDWTHIPNLNFGSLAVRDWLLDVVDEWSGVVDGFRCDVAWGVPHGFWKEVHDRTPADFLLLDETIPRDPAYHESEFHMHYDTTLYGALRDVGAGDEPADAVLDAVEDARAVGFPDGAVHLRYVENHDEDRYLDECGAAPLRAAAATPFVLPGAPMIYYGQERGMTEYRGPMAWHDGDTDLTEFHRDLGALRDDHDVLRDGDVERIDYDAPDSAVAFARDDGDDRVVVALNFAADAASVTLPEPVDGTDLLSGDDVATGERSVAVSDAVVLRTE